MNTFYLIKNNLKEDKWIDKISRTWGYIWYKTPYYSRTIKEAIECLQYRVNKMKTLL